MTRSLRLATLALVAVALAPASASAQSDVKDRALAYSAIIDRESKAGFDEFEKLETDKATQDAVCTHLAVGVRHMITANENANALISLLQDARMWDSYDAAHALGEKMSTTANRAIDDYNRQCEGWVERAPPS